MAYQQKQFEIEPGKTLTLETGKLAKQADGASVIRLGDTLVLVTVCVGSERDADFFPLTVEYREKAYATGKIPGGYFKREARPSEKEVLTCRIIDRPLRPMFPKGIRNDIQIVAQVLSADENYDADCLAVCAASVSVGLSSLPFEEQVAAVRVVQVNGEFIINPTHAQTEEAALELIVAGTENSIVMVEGGAYEVPESTLVEAITRAHESIKAIAALQRNMVEEAGSQKRDFPAPQMDEELFGKVEALCLEDLKRDFRTPMMKKQHYAVMAERKDKVRKALREAYEEREDEIDRYFGEIEKREMREAILSEGLRIDGRKTDEVRPIEIETSILPRAHGSALFQRGETQAVVTCTLGIRADEQRVDSLLGETFKNYYLHYNFPPFSVGETGRMTGPGRREIGHGHLAERALEPILPTHDSFSYTLRLVSEILESNGSSSMASVCGGSLSLMNAGVPVKAQVAGIAMGLITDGERVRILTDISGTEDHLGDMDFKITGTSEGVTACQMDIKIKGITPELMLQALEQARAGRFHILEKMNAVLAKPAELSSLAPCILKMSIPEERIKDLIGPGGKVIRGIQETSGSKLDVSDKGDVTITAPKRGNAKMALKMVEELFQEVEVGKQYTGKVKSITNFGAFVEVLPGREGLVHVSEMDLRRGERIDSIMTLGDELEVKCIGIDPQGRVRLSARQVQITVSE